MKKRNIMKKAAMLLAAVTITSAAAPAAPAQAAVKLSAKSVTMYSLQKKTLKITGTSKKIKWTSNKPAVASVTQTGKVTAVKPGTASIKAKVGGKTYTCRVTVKKPYLNVTEALLAKGQTLKLKLTGATAKEYFSYGPDTASVSKKGVVKANCDWGSVLIIVTDTKGRNYKCIINVNTTAAKEAQKEAEAAKEKEQGAQQEQEDDSTTVSTGTESTGSETVDNSSQNVEPSAAQGTQAAATQPSQTASTHTHDWVPHYTYDGTGTPGVTAMFCSDVTCPMNQGYGTDNGWRGETGPAWYDASKPGSGSTQATVTLPSGTATAQPAGNDSNDTQQDDTNNTGTQEGQPAQTETTAHRWTIPVVSGAQLTGYRCADCGEESHVHLWTGEITKSHPTLGNIITGRSCKYCSETITSEDFNTLRDNERNMKPELMDAWIADNITSGMSDLDKVRKAMAEMNSWTHSSTLPSDEQSAASCLSHVCTCLGGNSALADYCRAMGITAEVFSAGQYVGGDHYLTYVYVNGEKLIADGTPGGSLTGPGVLWTEDALWLYCDLLDGNITNEDYEAQIGQYER